MKDYDNPCIKGKNPEYVTLHVGTKELNSELTPERISKPIIDVGKIFELTIELSVYPV